MHGHMAIKCGKCGRGFASYCHSKDIDQISAKFEDCDHYHFNITSDILYSLICCGNEQKVVIITAKSILNTSLRQTRRYKGIFTDKNVTTMVKGLKF